MTFKKLSVSIATSAVIMAASIVPAFAQYGQYGGSQPADLSVNKRVRTPLPPFEYRDNLNEGDLRYSPDGEVIFTIAITNSGTQTFEEVKVEDFLEGDAAHLARIVSARVADEYRGTFNSTDHRLTFYVKDVKPGDVKTVEVTAKLAKAGYPANTDVSCEVNKVEVRSEERFDDDTARFCIQTNVLGATTLPQAGLEDYLPMLPFMLMGLAGVGLFINKRSV